MRIKSRTAIIFFLFVFMFIFQMDAYAKTQIEYIDTPIEIVYGADSNYPPFSYLRDDYLYGFDVDLIQLIFSTQDYSLRFSPDIWENILGGIEDGSINVSSSIARTAEREEYVLYTDPITVSHIGVYSSHEFSDVAIDDLVDLRIGVGNMYYEENILRDEIGIQKYETYHSLNEAVDSLINGRIDVIFSNQEVMDHYIVQNDLKGIVLPQITDLYPKDFYYGVSMERPELVDFINQRLNQLKRSGAYEELYQKYFYRRSNYYRTRQRNFYIGGLVLISIIILIAGFITFFNIKYLRRKIKREQKFSKKILDNANIMIIMVDTNGQISFANRYAHRVLGYEGVNLKGNKWGNIFRELTNNKEELNFIKCDNSVENKLTRVFAKDEKILYINWNICSIYDEEDMTFYSICMGLDITDRMKAQSELKEKIDELTAAYEELTAMEEELRNQVTVLKKSENALKESEQRYRLAVESTKDGIWELDVKNNILYWPDQTYELLGITKIKNGLPMDVFFNLCHEEDKGIIREKISDHINGNSEIYEVEFRIRTGKGGYKWFLSRGKAIYNNGKAVRMLGSNTDITDLKNSIKKIEYYAYYDSLTGLLNRIYFDKLLIKHIKNMSNKSQFAILFMDLDDFKNINDSLGHHVGDMLLENIGKKLQCFASDKVVISRFGGDEFTVLLKDIDNEEEVSLFAEKIIEIFKTPFHLLDKKIYITGSVGIVLYPKDSDNIDTLFKYADAAMYKAKEEGKNKYQYFTEEIHGYMLQNIEIANDLREAIEKEQFKVYYQPILEMKNNRIIGVEALIRWVHPVKGMISPMEFIPIAEANGMILNIGNWVLESACKQIVEWSQNGIDNIILHVNLSPCQLKQELFVDNVIKILNKTHCDPRYLHFEITENTAITDFTTTMEILKELKKYDIGISLDDFGTGFSSLNYLSNMPVDIVKIDKSFIDSIHESIDKEAIVKIIILLSHVLGIRVIAEGVELKKQVSLLKRFKCDYAQGYYFSKPVCADEMYSLLKKGEI